MKQHLPVFYINERLIRLWRVVWQTLKRFESMERRRDAAALTYTTLFALVPILTLSFTALSMIPPLRDWGVEASNELLTHILPDGNDVIASYLLQFSEQARELTWIGLIILFFTAFMLLKTIEGQFNKIWNVARTRSAVQNFFRYWAVLSLGPLLFGAAFATSSFISSLPLWNESIGLGLRALARVIPWLLTSAAVTVLYVMVPNCKVPIRHAVISAFIVASVFEFGKWIFSNAVGLFPSYKLIYGAFAAVPLFLTWLYISWMVVLLGAELSYGLSHHRRSVNSRKSAFQRLLLAQTVHSTQQSCGGVLEEVLRRKLPSINVGVINRYLHDFEKKGWVSLSHDDRWIWIRDPRMIPMREFLTDEYLSNILSTTDNIHEESNHSEHETLLWQRWQEWSTRYTRQTSTQLDESLDTIWYPHRQPEPV